MKPTTQEVVEEILALVARKAAASTDDLVPSGAPAQMAAQIEGPTSTVARVREIRARNKQLFEADPEGAALRFGGAVEGLLKLIGL